jgi:hypothetical protein
MYLAFPALARPPSCCFNVDLCLLDSCFSDPGDVYSPIFPYWKNLNWMPIIEPYHVALVISVGCLVAATPPSPAIVIACRVVIALRSKVGEFYLAETANRVLIVDSKENKPRFSVAMPEVPSGLCVSPDGKELYITWSEPQGGVGIVKLKRRKIIETMPAGQKGVGPA